MRIANIEGRLCLAATRGWIDVAESSKGRFDADPQAVYDRWSEFSEWAGTAVAAEEHALVSGRFGPPVPRPAGSLTSRTPGSHRCRATPSG